MLDSLRSGKKRVKAIWWVLAILTIFTFLIGFNFFPGLGRDSTMSTRATGGIGNVGGEKITPQEYALALEESRATFRQRFNSDPVDRDAKQVEQQAWRQLVNQRLMAKVAKSAGLKATDNEVIVGMQTNPPAAIFTAQAFQTNGKFDPAKYQQAMRNPNIDWSPFEAAMRAQLPVRKLQERLMASLKLSDSELRETFHDRYDRLTATIVQVPPADTGSSAGTDADLQKVYDRYKARMATGAKTQLEVLAIPFQYSADEVKTAMDLAQSLFQRASKGEDFATLARDYSEGPNAQHGGVLDRFMNPMELGPVGASIMAHKPGEIVAPYREAGSVAVFKILDPKVDSLARGGQPGQVKLAQIMIKLHPSTDGMRDQFQAALKLQKRAKDVGLAKAATEKGLTTQKTPFFDLDNVPPALYSTPEAADWGVAGKKGDVSPVFQGPEEFLIATVATQHLSGPPTREEVQEQLKQMADIEHRVERSKTRADQIAAALKSGAKLEDAAKAAGLTAFTVSLTRQQPDPRVFAATELQGALWTAKPGQVIGPVRAPGAWYFGRVETVAAAPDTMFNDQLKGQLTTDILTRRQRTFFDGYLTKLRSDAKIVDARASGQQQ